MIHVFDKKSKQIGRLTKLGLGLDTIARLLHVTRNQAQYHGSWHAYGYREKIRKGLTPDLKDAIERILR